MSVYKEKKSELWWVDGYDETRKIVKVGPFISKEEAKATAKGLGIRDDDEEEDD